MWRITITCSAESWGVSGTTFKAIADKYNGNLLSSKKMKDDGRRIMDYQIESVSDAEAFTEECFALPGFTAVFESL